MVPQPSLLSALLFTEYSAFISLVAASMVLPQSARFVREVSCQSFGSLVSAPTVYLFSPQLILLLLSLYSARGEMGGWVRHESCDRRCTDGQPEQAGSLNTKLYLQDVVQ